MLIGGIDKLTGRRYEVLVDSSGFDEWQKGVPLKYALPNLDEEAKNFLTKGSTE